MKAIFALSVVLVASLSSFAPCMAKDTQWPNPDPSTWASSCQNSNGDINAYLNGLCCNPSGNPSSFYPELSTSICKPGFFCPFVNDSSLPQFCPPTTTCNAKQLTSGFCEPQILTQPLVCPGGYYCPTNSTFRDQNGNQDYAQTALVCPKGYFCPGGTVDPIKCWPLAGCKEGSEAQAYFGGLLIAGVVDVLVIVALVAIRRRANEKIRLAKEVSLAYQRQVEEEAEDLKSRKDIPTDISPGLMESYGSQLNYLSSLLGNSAKQLLASVEHFNAVDPESKLPESTRVLVENFREGRGRVKEMKFEFTNLKLHIPEKVCKEEGGKTILNDVTGSLDPGKVTAIMGPSGAGKTTFLTTLMGKVDRKFERTGRLTINGQGASLREYKSIVGYVPQEDVMMRELTVRDNVLHAARCRLPSSWNESQVQNHVDAILHTLQLSHVAESPIGDERVRGISGGQRKRVNVALELAAVPRALFLDEPTSGLDSTSALVLCDTLNTLAKMSDLTVAMVIHQPRPEIFAALDELLLLAPGGRTVYQGPQSYVEDYFRSVLGCKVEGANVADALMDGIAENGDEYVQIWKDRGFKWVAGKTGHAVDLKSEHHNTLVVDVASASAVDVPHEQVFSPPVGEISLTPKVDYHEQKSMGAFDDHDVIVLPEPRGASLGSQTWFCLKRAVKQQFLFGIGNFYFEILTVMVASLIAAPTASNFQGALISPYDLISPAPEYGNIPAMCLSIGFFVGVAGATPTVRLFTNEQTVYWRESSSGHSRLAYYLAKNLLAIPRGFIIATNFAAVYFVIGSPNINFYGFWLYTLLMWWAVYGISYCAATLAPREDANLVATILVIFAATFNSTVAFPKAVVSTSYAYWGSEAIQNLMGSDYSNIYNLDSAADFVGYSIDRLALDFFMMLLIGLIYRIVAYLGLIFVNRRQQE